MSATNTNPVLGVVVLARHGDREGFYQTPGSYTPSDTAITPLGEVQNYNTGQMLRSIYADDSSPNNIEGLSNTTLIPSQVNITADAGGEGSVISDSANALWQGFYPPNAAISNATLANGTTVASPLGGYQYVKVNTVLPSDDVDLESWVNCKTWSNRTSNFYTSPEFLARQEIEAPFLQSIKDDGLVGDRNISMANMWNIYDFMLVQSIHNETYAALLNASAPGTIEHARDIANYHEYGSFTDSTPGGIGNVAGRAFIPRIISSLRDFSNDSEVKIAHTHFSYKPFLSIFNMTGLAQSDMPFPQGIVDFASAAVFELRANAAGTGHDVRFGFRNGSTQLSFDYYPLWGSDSLDTDLDTFASNLEPYLLPNATSWCHACSNSVNSGCDIVALADNYKLLSEQLESKSHFTPVGAGFIGFAVTLVVGLLVLAAMRALGLASFGKRSKASKAEYPLDSRKGAESVASSHI